MPFWIGPPEIIVDKENLNEGQRKILQTLAENLNPYYDQLKSAAEKHGCTLIDFRPFTKSPNTGFQTSDGVHRTHSAGVFWLQSIKSKIYRFLGESN